ncbi:rRNA maturation RNase YbeY [Aureisphaera galaxeae]|uniref:rRNA maturation RNase YbeY n=1 Tax=Aureisphaera galaxeae TaxID=1538023 RepID=UPI002350816D|nr:rRNA maturation RNase YbeY [Aureisphaera galaxeae]MDC8005092.1 rRNA maturation RNase YbeY [Aureisphaera galaxeae]
MIEFHSQNDFILDHQSEIRNWISKVVVDEGYELGDVNYVFCSDEYLHEINLKFLEHDTYTDIISFDYTMGKMIGGEIYISTDRVKDNATDFGTSFESELHRVIIHGILHYCGYKDKSEEEGVKMREMEDLSLKKLLLN